MKYTIGIDIGGTNTDAVLVDENSKMIYFTKTLTTDPLDEGFYNAISKLLEIKKVLKKDIKTIIVGTTHALNAILQRKDLYKVGLIRIAGQFFDTLPPLYGVDEVLKKQIFVDAITINGGFECDGKEISKFNETEAKKAIKKLIDKGSEAICVCSVFSPIYNKHEKLIADLIKEEVSKNFPISLSYEVGSIGYIERENSAILNAALKKSLSSGFNDLKKQLIKLNLRSKLYLTENNGSLLDIDKAIEYPILTMSSGPTNSFIGACRLANILDAIVVDIGGTTTDIGVVKNGFVRRSINLSKIDTIDLNFSMPDLLSVAIGGGSYIDLKNKKIGPKSAGKNLFKEAVFANGNKLTMTDLAICFDSTLKIEKKDSFKDKEISKKYLQTALDEIKHLINQMRAKDTNLKIILVGGGAMLFKKIVSDQFIIPECFEVANAYGAALAEVSGNEDNIVSLKQRQKTLNEIIARAKNNAIKKGAVKDSIRISDIQIIPYHYIPNSIARVIVTVAGQRK
ncbi:MAG: Acetophenone carboxylase gamma subunit [Candidatus Anoxychlamydiales bacterium]|nr:Acetophenone carboxylase gamma subunit [Candidatus Anoxychlamydiales bacterium]